MRKEVVEDLRSQTQTGSKAGTFTTHRFINVQKFANGAFELLLAWRLTMAAATSPVPFRKFIIRLPPKEHLKAYEPKLYCLVVGVWLSERWTGFEVLRERCAQAVTTAGKRLWEPRQHYRAHIRFAQWNRKPIKANIAQAMKTIAAQAQIDDWSLCISPVTAQTWVAMMPTFIPDGPDAWVFFIDPAIRQGLQYPAANQRSSQKVIPAQKQYWFSMRGIGADGWNMLKTRCAQQHLAPYWKNEKMNGNVYSYTGCSWCRELWSQSVRSGTAHV